MVKCTYLPSLETCPVRQLENGYFSNRKNVYKEGEKAIYACYDDYQTEHGDGEVTCTKSDWSPPPRCIRRSECPYILLGFLAKTSECKNHDMNDVSPSLLFSDARAVCSTSEPQCCRSLEISCISYVPVWCPGQLLSTHAECNPVERPHAAHSDRECNLWGGSHSPFVLSSEIS